MNKLERLKVLVVDDDPDIRNLLETYFSSKNYDVSSAQDGRDALEKLKNLDVDIIISDIMMPEMDGIDFLKSVVRDHPDLAIIMLTSLNEIKVAIQAMQIGAFDYITKPVDFSNLDIRVKNARAKQKLILENLAYKKRLEEMVKEQGNVIKEQRAQLLQADKLSSIGVLVGGVCHEINNPLSFIKSNAELLGLYFGGLKGALEDYAAKKPDYRLKNMTMAKALENIKSMLDDSLKGVHKIKDIVDDIMGYSRKRGDDKRVFCLKSLVDNTISVSRFITKNRVKIETEFHDEEVELFGNPHKMEQVLMNLIHNAAYATKDTRGATISISVAEAGQSEGEGKRVAIQIKDNGPGISEEVRERIFEPYFTTKPPGEGTGLGLSISREIVEEYNGTMLVESGQSRGAVFIITLPAVVEGCQPGDNK